MNSDTTVHALRSLAKNYDQVNYKIDKLLAADSDDTLIKWATLAVALISVVAGLVIFHLTRSKEFKMRRGDIAGDIMKRFAEYRLLAMDYTFIRLYRAYNNKLMELLNNADYIDETYRHFGQNPPDVNPIIKTQYENDAKEKLILADLKELRKGLQKEIFQYEFFLYWSRTKRKFNESQMDFMVPKVPVEFDFSSCTDETKLGKKYIEYYNTYPNEVAKSYFNSVIKIEKFLKAHM